MARTARRTIHVRPADNNLRILGELRVRNRRGMFAASVAPRPKLHYLVSYPNKIRHNPKGFEFVGEIQSRRHDINPVAEYRAYSVNKSGRAKHCLIDENGANMGILCQFGQDVLRLTLRIEHCGSLRAAMHDKVRL